MLLLTILSTCILSVRVFGSAQFYRRPDLRIIRQSYDGVPTADSLLHCTSICMVNSSCLSAIFDADTHKCLISDIETIHDSGGENLYASGESKSGWITMSRIQFPILLARGSYDYSLTLPEARSECSSRGLRLANSTEMLDARAQGFHYCTCGWMDDNMIGAVLQYPEPNCLHSFHDGIMICDWLSVAFAWCLLPLI